MRRSVAPLVCALLLTAACSGDASDDSTSAPSSTTAPTSSTTDASTASSADLEPSLEPVDCPAFFDDHPRVSCSELTVAADRSDPDSGTVTLLVGTLRAAVDDPADDPVVYFSGGPGGDGLPILRTFENVGLANDRDVIVFDQRGTGLSRPSLDCDGSGEAFWATLGAAAPVADEVSLLRAVFTECRDRLVAALPAGVDLDDFDTPTTAADARDLRLALGIDEWNAFGISYGTTVALELTRQDPDGVRSLVLDSVYPTTVGLSGARVAANAERAIGELFDACEADPGCNAEHPDLRSRFDALVDEWNADPYATEIDDDGTTRTVVLTGADVVAGLFNVLYDETLIPALPDVIALLEPRDLGTQAVVTQLAVRGVGFLTQFAEGVAATVDCADRAALDQTDQADQAMPIGPRHTSLALFDAGFCDLWDVEPVDSSFNDPVTVDVPALVFGNRFDPVTPPDGSRQVAEALPRATYVEFPTLGHGATLADDCPIELFRWFVADPAAPVDATCVGGMTLSFT